MMEHRQAVGVAHLTARQQQQQTSSPYYHYFPHHNHHHLLHHHTNSAYDAAPLVTSSLDYRGVAAAAAAAQQFLPFVQQSSPSTAEQQLFPAGGFYNRHNNHQQQQFLFQLQQQQLQQQQLQQQQLQQQQLQQQQLQQQRQLQQQCYDLFALQQLQQQHPQYQFIMASSSQPEQEPGQQQETSPPAAPAAGLTDEQLAEYQKLSNEYEPEVTGPLVGQRQPSTAITSEYASADPAYQRKTAALPLKYSHYRTVRGDGRCGWRAIAFGYFETLISLGDTNKLLSEEGRLRLLANVLNSAGFDPMLYEDFADETFQLIRRLVGAFASGTAETVLLDTFNDEELQNYIITHLKTLASAWIRTHPDDYQPWILGQTVEVYTDNAVMPILSEIDHVSLSALKDVFLSPAAISLEIVYLDRSEGDEVNTHYFPPNDSSVPLTGTIRLLYRPGHYDILYKHGDVPPSPTTVPTYLQFRSNTQQEPAQEVCVSDFLTMIPGISYAGPPQSFDWLSGSGPVDSNFSDPSSKQQIHHQCTPPTSAGSSISSVQSHQSTYFPMAALPRRSQSEQQQQQQRLVRVLPIRRKTSLDSALQDLPLNHPHSTGPFRSSAWELEPDFVQATSQGPLRTREFQNSHYNTAHFMNPAFHPEQWHPDDDEAVPSSSSMPRHKSTG